MKAKRIEMVTKFSYAWIILLEGFLMTKMISTGSLHSLLSIHFLKRQGFFGVCHYFELRKGGQRGREENDRFFFL